MNDAFLKRLNESLDFKQDPEKSKRSKWWHGTPDITNIGQEGIKRGTYIGNFDTALAYGSNRIAGTLTGSSKKTMNGGEYNKKFYVVEILVQNNLSPDEDELTRLQAHDLNPEDLEKVKQHHTKENELSAGIAKSSKPDHMKHYYDWWSRAREFSNTLKLQDTHKQFRAKTSEAIGFTGDSRIVGIYEMSLVQKGRDSFAVVKAVYNKGGSIKDGEEFDLAWLHTYL
jgi:hypothetical protein